MQTNLTWKDGLAFGGENEEGFSVDLDGAPEAGGGGAGFRPMQLLALGVGGCTAMDVISILQKKRQQVSAFEVRVHTEKAESHPKVWTSVLIEYLITGTDIDPAAVERAIELSASKYCPAQNMINQAVDIEHSYQILAA